MKNSEIKKTIRREILQRRDSIAKNLKAEKDISILQHIIMLPEFSAAKKILFYASFRSEADTMDMIKLSLHLGKLAVLPRVCRKRAYPEAIRDKKAWMNWPADICGYSSLR